MGTQHDFEIPFTLDLPGALGGDKVTRSNQIMGSLARTAGLRRRSAISYR
jgi:hypothetical protein